jgi:protein involved in polysaccharide export with SLBB domain
MKRKLVDWLLLFLFFMLLPHGCSRTFRGTPVKDMPHLGLTRETPPVPLTMQEELRRLSRVRENAVFTEKRGYPEYKVGPLDVLGITARAGSEYKTDTVMIRSDGTISYSFVDDLPVEGLTAREVDERLTERMSRFIRKPRIDVVVKEFNSKSALVMGEIGSLRYAQYQAASGRVFLKGKTTLLDVLVMAGGYTKDADIKRVKLIRGDKIWYINLYDLIYRGETEQNVIVDDGDVVDVPELPEYGERVYVLGEVSRQGVYSLKDAPDLLAALSFAGSYTRTAIEENTMIIRGYQPGKKPVVLTADVSAILKRGDIGQNIPLMDGDVVYVPRSSIGDINEFIVNTVPLLDYLLYPGRYRDAYGSYEHLRFKY